MVAVGFRRGRQLICFANSAVHQGGRGKLPQPRQPARQRPGRIADFVLAAVRRLEHDLCEHRGIIPETNRLGEDLSDVLASDRVAVDR